MCLVLSGSLRHFDIALLRKFHDVIKNHDDFALTVPYRSLMKGGLTTWSALLCSWVKCENLWTACVWLGESDLSLVSAGFQRVFEGKFCSVEASLRKANNETFYVKAKFPHQSFNTSWPVRNEFIVESAIPSATKVRAWLHEPGWCQFAGILARLWNATKINFAITWQPGWNFSM